jgi:hypothetical protein
MGPPRDANRGAPTKAIGSFWCVLVISRAGVAWCRRPPASPRRRRQSKIRFCNGIISSSQVITATARNSNPFAKCMVPIETLPLAVSTLSSSVLNATRSASAAACARLSCSADRTNTANLCGNRPFFAWTDYCAKPFAPDNVVALRSESIEACSLSGRLLAA